MYEVEYAYQTYLNEVGLQAYAEMKPEHLTRLIDDKRRELLASQHEKTYRKMPPEAFDEHVRYLIRKEMAAAKAVPLEEWLGSWTR